MIELYVDASMDTETGEVGIGVYNKTNNVKLSYAPEFTFKNINSAENYAINFAIHYAKMNGIETFRIFTDSKHNYDEYMKEKYKFYELHWLPREHNKVADALAVNARKKAKVCLSYSKEKSVQKTTDIEVIDKNTIQETNKVVKTTTTIERKEVDNICVYIAGKYSIKERMQLVLKSKVSQEIKDEAKYIIENDKFSDSFREKMRNISKEKLQNDIDARFLISFCNATRMKTISQNFSKKKFKGLRIKNKMFMKLTES